MKKQAISDFKMLFDGQTYACKAPCSMYSVLLENGAIEDPFFGRNTEKLTDYSRRDTVFTSRFTVSEDDLCKRHVLLRFFGLDTFCRVELNGKTLGETDNMHRTYVYDVKNDLVAGENELKLSFRSAVTEMEKRQAEHFLRGDNNAMYGMAHIRKANYMSGWDWAPKLPDMGIFRPIELDTFDTAMIDEVDVRQHHENGKVTLEIKVDVFGELNGGKVVLRTPIGGIEAEKPLENGQTGIVIDNPEYWWPNGMGAQALYDLCVITDEDEKHVNVGLRTLTVSTAADEWGNEFAFTVNGHKFFAMGADYIPEDSLLSRTTREKTEKLIRDAVEAHFNIMRVWGGGIYPSDDFYDLCDRYGIVIWQDYMVACSNVWMKYKENYRLEFIDNIRRIRTHPCLGLLCGNNEVEVAVKYWDNYGGEEVKADYVEFYENLLPSLCREYVPDLFYWPSSPSSGGNFDKPDDENRGDVHFWMAWHGGRPYKETIDHHFRFCSEFGYQSVPCYKTCETFTEPDDRNLFSPVMEFHQKNAAGNTKMLTTASQHYRYAENFSDLCYLTQLLQADVLAYSVEHMRRERGRCMGAIYWQLNDCWPVSSWASIDWYGRWKGLHYRAKRFFAPVLLSIGQRATQVQINLSNETGDTLNGNLRYEVRTRDNEVLYKKDIKANVNPYEAVDVEVCDLCDIVRDRIEDTYVIAFYHDEKYDLKTDAMLFCEPKAFAFRDPKISVEVRDGGEFYEVTVASDTVAKAVELDFADSDGRFSDNWFDLTGEPVTVRCVNDKKRTAEELKASLTVRSLYNIGRN